MIRFSICIPHYNKAEYLLKMLQDIKGQSVMPYEVLIQDDASNDINKNLLLTYEREFQGIFKFYYNEKNLGMYPNINSLVLRVSGDYVAICHNDDRISPFYVERLLQIIEKNPNKNIFTTNICAMDGTKLINEYRLFRGNRLIKKNQDIKYLWRSGKYVFFAVSGGTCYRTSFLKKNLFKEDLKTEADLYSGLKFMRDEDIFYLDVPIYYVSVDGTNTSALIRKDKVKIERYLGNVLTIYDEFSDDFSWINTYPIAVKVLCFWVFIFRLSFSYERALSFCGLNRTDTLKIVFFTFLFVFQLTLKKILFIVNYKNITPFLPRNYVKKS